MKGDTTGATQHLRLAAQGNDPKPKPPPNNSSTINDVTALPGVLSAGFRSPRIYAHKTPGYSTSRFCLYALSSPKCGAARREPDR